MQIAIRSHVSMKDIDKLVVEEIKEIQPGKYEIEGWYGIAGIAPIDSETSKTHDANWRISVTKSDRFSDIDQPFPDSPDVILYREEIWMASTSSKATVSMVQSQGLPWGMFARPIEADIEKLYVCLGTNAFHVPNDATICILARKIA